MATITEVEKLDDDDGIAEALLRDAELNTNPALGMSLEELDQEIEGRRR